MDMIKSFLTGDFDTPEFEKIELAIADELKTAEFITPEATAALSRQTLDNNLASTEATDLAAAAKEAQDILEKAEFPAYLQTLIGAPEGVSQVETEAFFAGHQGYQAGMTAAMIGLIASADPAKYNTAYNAARNSGPSDSRMLGIESGFDIEGFDNFDFSQFTVKSALIAGVTAGTSPFSQTFFRPVVLPASQNGYDMRVQIPETYRRRYRPGTGAHNDFPRKSLVRAAIDSTILADNSTTVYPVADSARETAGSVVAAAPARTVEQHGVSIQSKPIPYGKSVDLIDVSSNSELVRLGAMTEQDTLDPLVRLGEQVITATIGGDTNYFAVDLATLPSAMLNYTAEGDVKGMTTVFEGSIWVHSSDEDEAGAALLGELDLSTLAWITAGQPYRFEVKLRISASIDQDANMRVDLNEVSVGRVQHGAGYATEASDTEATAFETLLDLNGSGYYPVSRRSNSNMRDTGVIVDAGRTYNYRLAAPLGAPLTTVKPPVAMGNGVSLDTLSSVSRLRNLGTMVTTLLDFEGQLIATRDLDDTQAAAIGGMLIKPTYSYAQLDVETMVRTRDSRYGNDDLRTHLVNAITMMANDMIYAAGYLPALEMYTGSRGNFEVIVVTDPIIANHLMTSGDGRTLGNNRRFKVTEVDDERMEGRIYLSLARTDVSGPDILSLGAHVNVPSLVHNAQLTLGGSTSQQTQIIPRDSFHILLPFLGRIDVQNLVNFYLQVV